MPMSDESQEFDWESLNEMFEFIEGLTNSQKEQLERMSAAFQQEVDATQLEAEAKELLFVGGDGDRVIKMLHYPFEALQADGPVVFPSANPRVLIGAVSDELITRKIAEYTEQYADDRARQRRWELYLNTLAVDLIELDAHQRGWDEYDHLLETTYNQQSRGEPGHPNNGQTPYDQDQED